MSATGTRERLRVLLEPVITKAGLDLEDVELTPAGKRKLLRVIVDCDGGVGLDEVAKASQAVSAALDEEDPIGGPYVLEVTSPGVGRPLTQPRHWRRAKGRLVEATTAEDGTITARVLDADDTGATLDLSGAAHRVAYTEIIRAKVQVEFSRADDDQDGAAAHNDRNEEA